MNTTTRRISLVAVLALSTAMSLAGADRESSATSPQPRPRLTDTLRAQAERGSEDRPAGPAVPLEKYVVRESRLPSGPPKEEERQGPFTLSQGGYLLKNRGEKFSTEVGLWRHLDIMEEPTVQLRQSTRIRMGFLKVSW